jgi:hypothetical protein
MGLFIKKPFAALQAEANESGNKTLKRVLGPWSLIALGVGVIIGAGLFSITGTVAAGYTGPAITLSFAIAAIGCCFAGLCYAEFASMIPVAGSAQMPVICRLLICLPDIQERWTIRIPRVEVQAPQPVNETSTTKP